MKEKEQGKRAAEEVLEHLWWVMKACGIGTITRVEDAFGLSRGTLYQRRRRLAFRTQQVCEILAFLDYPVSVFFAEAFGDEPRSVGDRFRAEGALLLARGYGGELPNIATPMQPDTLHADDLDALDQARFEDPRRAIQLARKAALAAAADGRQGDAAACFARMGSALRAAERWQDAHAAVCWALNQAPEGPIRADSWRRAGSVVSDYGDFGDAAELARLSMTEFGELADSVGVARSLVSRGIFLHRAGRYRDAISRLRAALPALPIAEHFAIHQTLGLAYLNVRDLCLATEHADKAATLGTSRIRRARGVAPCSYRVCSRRSRPRDAALRARCCSLCRLTGQCRVDRCRAGTGLHRGEAPGRSH